MTALRKAWIEAAPPDEGFGPAPEPRRHAHHTTDRRPRIGDHITTLAGEHVVVTEPTPGRPAPECRACDRRWRLDEGIEQRDEHLDTLPNPRPTTGTP